jgi:CHAD domain-containing protein
MAKGFVLRRKESLEQAFRRIAAEQLTRAATALAATDLSPERRVHDVRKRFKESRALLRLYRLALGDAFAEQNRWYRDAGRALGAYRDATATVDAVKALAPKLRGKAGRRAVRELLRLVRERRDALYGDAAAVDAAFSGVLAGFAAERLRVYDVPLQADEDAIVEGMTSSIAAERKAMDAALSSGDDVAFHEWRKRVKDDWYQVRLFVPVWPELMTAREEALGALSHLLGEYHDIAVIGQIVRDFPEAKGLARVLAGRQKALAGEARPIAQRVLAARSRRRARETVALWALWHRGKR